MLYALYVNLLSSKLGVVHKVRNAGGMWEGVLKM